MRILQSDEIELGNRVFKASIPREELIWGSDEELRKYILDRLAYAYVDKYGDEDIKAIKIDYEKVKERIEEIVAEKIAQEKIREILCER